MAPSRNWQRLLALLALIGMASALQAGQKQPPPEGGAPEPQGSPAAATSQLPTPGYSPGNQWPKGRCA